MASVSKIHLGKEEIPDVLDCNTFPEPLQSCSTEALTLKEQERTQPEIHIQENAPEVGMFEDLRTESETGSLHVKAASDCEAHTPHKIRQKKSAIPSSSRYTSAILQSACSTFAEALDAEKLKVEAINDLAYAIRESNKMAMLKLKFEWLTKFGNLDGFEDFCGTLPSKK